MSSQKNSAKNAYDLSALVRRKFSSGKIPAEIRPYIGKEYGKRKRILFIEWGAEWNDNEKAKNAKQYYSGELDYDSHIDIKNCSQRRELEEALLNAKDCVSVESLAWYNFFIRPMQPGSCDFVRELFDISDEKERKEILKKMGIEKIDLEKSSDMFMTLIRSFCPDIILIFGDTLKDVLDNDAFGKMNFEEMLHSRYSSPVSVHVIPFSYFEKVDLDSQLNYMENRGFDDDYNDVISDIKKESEKYDYSEVAFYLQNELKMLGLGDYEYYKEKITECQEMVLKDWRDYEEYMWDIESGKKRTIKISCLNPNEKKNGKNHGECRHVDLGVGAMKVLAESRLRACFFGIEREHMYFNLLCSSFDEIFDLTKRYPNEVKQRNGKKASKVSSLEANYKNLRLKRKFSECRNIEIELSTEYNVVVDKTHDEPKFINLNGLKKRYKKLRDHGNRKECEEIKKLLKKLGVIIEDSPDGFKRITG